MKKLNGLVYGPVGGNFYLNMAPLIFQSSFFLKEMLLSNTEDMCQFLVWVELSF